MAIDDTLDTTATFSVMTDDQRRQENNRMEGGIMDRFMNKLDKITSRIFRPFEHDPQGSVFRFWGACLIAMTVLFIAACIEAKLMRTTYGSAPIVVAAIWTALVQLFMGVVGTFVLRRFPTEFSVGFFLGLLLIVAQQNFILFATFSDVTFNLLSEQKSSKLFAALIFLTAVIYLAFAVLLTHFRDQILLAPVDVKTVITRLDSISRDAGDHDHNAPNAAAAAAAPLSSTVADAAIGVVQEGPTESDGEDDEEYSASSSPRQKADGRESFDDYVDPE